MRAICRVQAALLGASATGSVEAAVAGALAVYDFCLREREDALLASSSRLSDFSAPSVEDARSALERLNGPIDPFLSALARRLGGRSRRDIALLAIRDLPYGAALPHSATAPGRPPRGARVSRRLSGPSWAAGPPEVRTCHSRV